MQVQRYPISRKFQGAEILRTSSLQQPVLTLTSFIRWFILPKDFRQYQRLVSLSLWTHQSFLWKDLSINLPPSLFGGFGTWQQKWWSPSDEGERHLSSDRRKVSSLWWSSAVDWFKLLQASFCLEDWNKCILKPWLYTYLSKWIFQPPIKSQDGVKSN